MNSGKPAAYDQNFQLTERRVMKSTSGWGGRDKGPGARFSKVPIINGPGKRSPFTLKIEVSIVLHLT